MYAELKIACSKPWVPMILCGILVLFTLLELTFGLHAFFSSEAVGLNQPSTLAAAIPAESTPLDRDSMLKMPFFGDYVPESAGDADVKQSALHLSLVGVLFSSYSDDSQVIIRLPDKKEQVFRLGDELPGGAVIKRILQNEIFMVRKGVVESLSLPKNELIFAPPAPPLVGG